MFRLFGALPLLTITPWLHPYSQRVLNSTPSSFKALARFCARQANRSELPVTVGQPKNNIIVVSWSSAYNANCARRSISRRRGGVAKHPKFKFNCGARQAMLVASSGFVPLFHSAVALDDTAYFPKPGSHAAGKYTLDLQRQYPGLLQDNVVAAFNMEGSPVETTVHFPNCVHPVSTSISVFVILPSFRMFFGQG
ncbi:hypothetical protein K438DRAFT_814698 [Mycena galopus ATCC 62051]|nr:hypothetical protein K438DRAFT_814698 [Mycena galopus ATCC 62051]